MTYWSWSFSQIPNSMLVLFIFYVMLLLLHWPCLQFSRVPYFFLLSFNLFSTIGPLYGLHIVLDLCFHYLTLPLGNLYQLLPNFFHFYVQVQLCLLLVFVASNDLLLQFFINFMYGFFHFFLAPYCCPLYSNVLKFSRVLFSHPIKLLSNFQDSTCLIIISSMPLTSSL